MNNKLEFAIENIEEVKENPDSSFAFMKVDFFASGDNAHNLWVSEETLRKTAKTIYNVPIVWKYDFKTDDALGHEEDEYPVGVVLEGSLIEEKKLPDGRTMLTVPSLIWKKYSGRLVDVFKRDKKKSVSVEMSVLDATEENGRKELLDYKFEAITILGRGINPAIPLAEMTALSFAEEKAEFDKALKEFAYDKYSSVDFLIPEKVKEFTKQIIEEYESTGKGGNSVSVSNLKYILKNEKITPEKVRMMYKKLSSYSKKSNMSDEEKTRFNLWGGEISYSWVSEVFKKLEEIDNKRNSFFAEEQMPKEVKEDTGEKQTEGKEEMSVEKEIEKEEMAVEEKAEDVKKEGEEKAEEKMAEETPSSEEKEAEEKPEPEEEKMSLDSYLDLNYVLKLLEEETEGEESYLEQDAFAIKYALDEMKKEGEKSFESISKGMFAKMKKMACKMEKMAEENKAYMSMKEEFEALKSFKKSVEESRFSFEVESTLKDVEAVMPKDEMEKAREDSKNFSLDTIDAWKNGVKAKAFTFSSGKSKEVKNEIPRWSFNIETSNSSKKELWEIK